jgi:ATP-dependent 26S proteasome regulatory subunit
VFVEDIDSHTPEVNDRSAVAELLDVFDGIGVKDREIILIATTNHIETVPAGMLRPGRMDGIVEIAGLDQGGVERLIRAIVPSRSLDPNVDFDAVYAEMEGFLPAWVKAVGDRAQSFALARSGQAQYRLTTEDLVYAARSLHPQLGLMRAATEGTSTPELHVALRNEITKAVGGVHVVDYDGDKLGVHGMMLARRGDD